MNLLKQLALAFICLVLMLPFAFSEELPPYTSEQTVLEITTDVKSDVYTVVLTVDEKGRIVQGKVDKDVMSADKFVNDIQQGMKLSEFQGRQIVTLTGEDFHPEYGGDLRLRYLVRPIMWSYRTMNFSLERNKGQWQIISEKENGDKTVVKKLHILTRKFFGVPIGINKVLMNNEQ